MVHLGFQYTVAATIELSGYELSLLRRCSLAHYDDLCRQCFQPGPEAFGYGWVTRWTDPDVSRHMPIDEVLAADPDRVVSVDATTRQLDLCLKILEAADLEIRDLRGPELRALRAGLRAALDAISAELKRVYADDAAAILSV